MQSAIEHKLEHTDSRLRKCERRMELVKLSQSEAKRNGERISKIDLISKPLQGSGDFA